MVSHVKKMSSKDNYKVVFIKTTENYYYILVNLDKLDQLKEAMQSKKSVNIDTYGKIMQSGLNYPSHPIIKYMQDTYGAVT